MVAISVKMVIFESDPKSEGSMGDAVFGAAREVWHIVIHTITNPGPWLVAALMVIALGGVVFIRGKLSAVVWVPALTLAAYVGYTYIRR